MSWASIANFVFKEVPTFTKMNQILENLKVHNHAGANQGLRIDTQLAPATVPAPNQGTVTFVSATPVQVATVAVPATPRNASLKLLITQTGANIVTWTFTGVVGATVPAQPIKGFQPTTTSQSYFFEIPMGPVPVAGDINIIAQGTTGNSVAVRAWVSN